MMDAVGVRTGVMKVKSKARLCSVSLTISLMLNVICGIYFAPRVYHKVVVNNAGGGYQSNIQYEIENKIYPIDRGECDVVFLGDSITCYGEWEVWYPQFRVLNRGIGSDTTEGVLHRLDEVISHSPKYVFLMIGINDVSRNIAATNIIENVDSILKILTNNLPETRVCLYSILPCKTENDGELMMLNSRYAIIADAYEQVNYIDIYDAFRTEKGLRTELFTDDGVHLNEKGYKIWMQYIDFD